ncbi:RAMP superfamily CRISPR-associated protein [Sulfurovum sp.]|uniref:RAMP superfamily CRISPR-associated protein n=1 Tax=Sulfurovum sp. TaxID=1969726 RepID=UPI0025CFD05E|nr:RAMP superfamily CRISPR-associated protein [Sulfurovum sp.]
MKTKYIAHIILEMETPLKVGSNASDAIQDSPIQRDWNGLPMILGTSIAGVLRKDFEGDDNEVFGKDFGSKVIISNALLLDEQEKVQEGLLTDKSEFLRLFDTLPIREHTAITNKGVAKERSKFDEEVVFKGSRFKFSLELIESSKEVFEALLTQLSSPSFRLGGGSTKGFGKCKVHSIHTKSVSTAEELADFKNSLNNTTLEKESSFVKDARTSKHISYTLKLTPDDFFMFGSGFGDVDADQVPVTEKCIDYDKKGLSVSHILMPASSLKGALAHRTTYHYNLQNQLYIGDENAKAFIAGLFGEAKNSKQDIDGSKGKLLFSDCFKVDREEHKVFDHVAIDRFTGGGIDGALFQEKTIAQKDEWLVEILMEKGVDEVFVQAFESALADVCSGLLALGGATTKGHGVFTGQVLKDGEVLDVR